MDFLVIFKVFGLDADDADAGTILDSGQAPSPHAQGWNKPQGETPRSDDGCLWARAWPIMLLSAGALPCLAGALPWFEGVHIRPAR